eukprot:1394840-Amorphochlora_amoeboformis.AAC.1
MMKASELNSLKAKFNSSVQSVPKESWTKTLSQRSQARKERFKAKSKVTTGPSAQELEANSKRKGVIQKLRDEELDDVKHMNQIILHAECQMARDVQIQRKKLKKQAEREEEVEWNKKMQQERIRGIKKIKEMSRIRRQKKVEDSKILQQQIAEREHERLRQKEIAEQEQQLIVARIKEDERRQEEEAKRRVEFGRKQLAEVMKANDAAARVKLRKKQEE